MRRAVGALLVVTVMGLVIYGVLGMRKDTTPQDVTAIPQDVVTVRAVIGSEKKPFFHNPTVKQRFAELGYAVEVDTAGSREIANPAAVNLDDYDFAFPSSSPAATKILTENPDMKDAGTPFFSPMVIATWQPVVELLTGAAMMRDVGGQPELDMAAYLQAVQEGKRWSDLPGAAEKYPATKSIMISTTNVRTSNSAAMYQALVSYVANGNRVVASATEADTVQPVVDQVFIGQGYVPSSSKEPMENYLNMGMGKAPMVFCYESQLIEAEVAGRLKPDMVMVRPSVSVYSQHTVVSRTENGRLVGELLSSDSELQKLAAQHGFRPQTPGVFEQTLQEIGATVPSLGANVIDPPAYEFGERMIEGVARQYGADQIPAPVSETDEVQP